MTSAGLGRWAPDRVLADLERLAVRAPTRVEFFDEAAARLQRAFPFDGACWHTLDPGSDLITQHRLQNLPDRFPILANNEYGVDDVNKFADLARAERKAATMGEATGDHPYGLTLREQEVAQLILRGATTIQAAQRLAISPHTITDHVKSIFDKSGARTRGELSATLFFGQHLPRIQDRTPIGDDASFIDAPRPRGQAVITAAPPPPAPRHDRPSGSQPLTAKSDRSGLV